MIQTYLVNPIVIVAIIFSVTIFMDFKNRNKELMILKVFLSAILVFLSVSMKQWLLMLLWIANLILQVNLLMNLLYNKGNITNTLPQLSTTTRMGYDGLTPLCPKCSRSIPNGSRFCKHCGYEVYAPPVLNSPYGLPKGGLICEKCQEEVPSDARFCPNCGKPVTYYGKTHIL